MSDRGGAGAEPEHGQTLGPPDLEALMQAYQQGNREAANQLIELVSPALYRFFAIHTGDRRHAEDLLQDAWLRIHKARHTYRPGERVLPWLYAIARYVKVDAYRKRRSERHEQPLDSAPEPAVPQVETRHDLRDIETLLGHLPDSQREVISLLKISGLSLEEAARATSSTVGSVKQKAHRAYEKLRALLGERA
jgi:RNA polymerase sigma-70 factor (ECF subfamily)